MTLHGARALEGNMGEEEKRRKGLKLTGKIVISALLPLIVLVVFVGLAIEAVGSDTAERLVNHELKTAAYAVTNKLRAAGDSGAYSVLLEEFSDSTEIGAVLFEGQTAIAASLGYAEEITLSDKDYQTLISNGSMFDTKMDIHGVSHMAYAEVLSDGKIIMTAMENEYITSIYYSLVRANLIFLAAIAGATCVIIGVVVLIVVKAIGRAVKNLDKVAVGELNFTIDNKLLRRSDEVGNIARNINGLIQSLAQTITGILRDVDTLNSFSNEFKGSFEQMNETIANVNLAVEEIAQGATSQAQETQKVNEQVLEIGNSIDETNKNVESLADSANEMKKQNALMNVTMQELIEISERTKESINLVHQQTDITNKSAQDIGEAVNIIADIATETNLLSLNASIEAARAGEQGRGFAVVADQVRKLAEQSNEAAGQIAQILSALLNNANSSVETMQGVLGEIHLQSEKLADTQKAFEGLNGEIGSVLQAVSNMTEEIVHLNDAKEEVMTSIDNLSAISEENAASTQETSASMTELDRMINNCSDATQELVSISDNLNANMSKFKL